MDEIFNEYNIFIFFVFINGMLKAYDHFEQHGKHLKIFALNYFGNGLPFSMKKMEIKKGNDRILRIKYWFLWIELYSHILENINSFLMK